MSTGGRRLRAWRRAFDLAVEVFRLTGRLEGGGHNGLGARLRRTAVRVPALVTRAAALPPGGERADDLRGAIDCLDYLARHLPICAAVVYSEPAEVRRITQQIGESRREIERLASRETLETTGAQGDRSLARDSLDPPEGAGRRG
jgi:hypothetical protein